MEEKISKIFKIPHIEIAVRYAKGESTKALAEEYGKSLNTIRIWINRATWRMWARLERRGGNNPKVKNKKAYILALYKAFILAVAEPRIKHLQSLQDAMNQEYNTEVLALKHELFKAKEDQPDA